MNIMEFLWAIGRATVFTSASALVALALVSLLRVRSPRLHRAVWFLAIMPGWMLVPWTWRIETPRVAAPAEALSEESLTTFTISQLAPAVADMPSRRVAPTNPATPLLIVYLAGMTAVVAVGTLRYLRFVRRVTQSDEALDTVWRKEWQRQLRAHRSRRQIELNVTADLGPLLCFVPFRYLVLVPRPLWTTLARAERIAILRHELAHWRRGDLWWSLAIRAIALPQWFNPLAWLAVRRFDEAGEWACDDRVARGRRTRELAFARCLLATAEYATTNSPGTAAIQGGQLGRRVHRLVSHRFKEEAMIKKCVLILPMTAMILAQVNRIERVAAEEPAPAATEPPVQIGVSSKPMSPARGNVLPAYVIEPPDMLSIQAMYRGAKSPQKIEPLARLSVAVRGTLSQPIDDVFVVGSNGAIDLGAPYGRVEVAGLTVDQAKAEIEKRLRKLLAASPDVSLSLTSSAAAQKIEGTYLVAPDGRVNLGVYGTVFVAGLTIDDATKAIEKQLANELQDPRVAVDVTQYNSKKFYIITRNIRNGDNVVAAPITGNETVLDALALVDETFKQSTTKIWISRPTFPGGLSNTLHVRWNEIVEGTSTVTNYQLLPGDRLFVANETIEAGVKPESSSSPMASKLVKFHSDFISDQSGVMKEFVGNAPIALVDSATITPALRILSTHNIIHRISAPAITCRLGETATVGWNSADSKPDSEALRLQLCARETEIGIVTELCLKDSPLGVDFAAMLKPGQTLLVERPGTKQQAKAIYIAVTPTILPPSPTSPNAEGGADSPREAD